jgi:hypothetical protein
MKERPYILANGAEIAGWGDLEREITGKLDPEDQENLRTAISNWRRKLPDATAQEFCKQLARITEEQGQ